MEEAKIEIDNTSTLKVGQNLLFKVITESQTQQPAALLLDNGLTIKTFSIYTNKEISLDGDLLQQAGLYKLTIIQQQQTIAKTALMIKAGDIVEPLEAFTGPVTILVDGQEESMITYIPSDKYDNAITRKETVNFKTTKGFLTSLTDTIEHLISYQKLGSDIKSEKAILGFSTNNLSSTEQVIEKIADWPESIELLTVKQHPYADNRQFTRIKTKRLLDKYGNQVADGTLVLITQSLNYRPIATYKCIVIDGVANAYLRNPHSPGTYSYQASVGPIKSKKLELSFQSLVNELPIKFDAQKRKLTIGPVVSTLGQLVPDGTEVTITAHNQTIKGETVEGKSFFVLKEEFLKHSFISVGIGGLEKRIDL